MRDVIVSLFGEYAPCLSPEGKVLGGIYSLDLTWIAGVLLFAIMLICVMKLIGGVAASWARRL